MLFPRVPFFRQLGDIGLHEGGAEREGGPGRYFNAPFRLIQCCWFNARPNAAVHPLQAPDEVVHTTPLSGFPSPDLGHHTLAFDPDPPAYVAAVVTQCDHYALAH